MAKKKKNKSRQARKEAQAKRGNMSPEQLMAGADQAMAAGKHRDAVTLLKQALKNGGQPEMLHPRLFEAYLYRAQGLQESGMAKEARATLKSAELYVSELSQLSSEVLLVCAGLFPLERGIPLCHRLSGTEGLSPEVEARFAMRLSVEGGWEALGQLPEASSLRADADGVQAALPHMHNGDWDAAFGVLRTVGKDSPYSPVRIFGSAMNSFTKGDDRGLKRALAALPETFPLKKTVATLSAAAQSGTDVPNGVPDSHLSLFWGDGVEARRLMAEVVRKVEARQFKAAVKSIKHLAGFYSPEFPGSYAQAIIEMVWSQVGHDDLMPMELIHLTDAVLSKSDSRWTTLRSLFFRGIYPFTDADRWLQAILAGVKDKELQNLLVGMLLVGVVQKFKEGGNRLRDDAHGLRKLGEGLDCEMHAEMSAGEMILALLEKAIEVDPLSRETYTLVPDELLHHSSRAIRDRVIALYLTMAEHFPEDPVPCLALATLYYRNNAFRKAEKVLADALKRAPHNTEVREKSALACLISADKNIRKGKGELARTDLSRAREMKVPSVASYLALKSAYCAIAIEKEDVHEVVIRELVPLEAVEKLRGMVLLHHDINQSALGNRKTLCSRLSSIFGRSRKQVAEFTSEEARRLLQPNPHVAFLYGGLLGSEFHLVHEPGALVRLSFEDFLSLIAPLVTRHTLPLLFREMQRRHRKSKGRERAALGFMVCVFEVLEGGVCDFRELKERSEELSPHDLEVIRSTCRKLAFFARGAFKEALTHFEFEAVTGFPFPFAMDDDEDWIDDWDDDEDDDWERDAFLGEMNFLDDPAAMMKALMGDWSRSMQQEFIKGIEDVIVNQGLKGESDAGIRQIRKEVGKIPLFEAMMSLGEQLSPEMRRSLSREAHLFLFGRPRAKSGQKRR